MISGTLPLEAGKSYTEYYHRLDYVLTAVERGPVGVMRTGSELTDPKKHREFHADWARPYEGDDGLVIRLTGGARPTCFLVGALRRTESFDTPERVKLMSGLVVHLQQALRAQNKLTILNERMCDLAGALDAVGHGIVIAGAGSQVIHLNVAAERILRSEDGMQLGDGRSIDESRCAADRRGPVPVPLGRQKTCWPNASPEVRSTTTSIGSV